MRIADKMALQQVQSSIGKNRAETYNLQEQSATQRRINKPSDDPLSITRVMNAKSDEKNQKQFVNSLHFAKDFLSMTDQSLGEVTEILNRAKELALNQANEASSNTGTRQVVANEVEQLLHQTVQVANRKLGDRYIFSGFRTNQSPFSGQGFYNGDDGEIKIQINKDAFITMNIPGNKVFLGEGLVHGSIEESLVPKTIEDLERVKQEYQLEQERKLEQPLAQVYTRSPKTKGLVPVGTGESGALQSAPLATAGANVFNILEQLVISLRTDDQDGIQQSLDHIDLAFNQVTNARAQVGARSMVLTNTLEGLQKGIVDSKATASQLEDADVFQLVSDINKADTALKATLETSGRLIQPSLLDFLK